MTFNCYRIVQVLGLFVILHVPVSVADVAYHVAPSNGSGCPGGIESHRDLDFYARNFSLENVNVSLYLCDGQHTVTIETTFHMYDSTTLSIIGLTNNVKITSDSLEHPVYWTFEGNAEFCMKNVTVVGLVFTFEVSSLRLSSMTFKGNTEVQVKQPSCEDDATINATFIDCTFREESFLKASGITNLTLSDCTFLNISLSYLNNPLSVYNSKVYLNGDSEFIGANQSAVLAYFSDITFSGTVLFSGNSGYKGGALAIHSTTLYVDRDAKITFSNNNARTVGGAIYVDSSTTPLRPDEKFANFRCFYQILHPLESSTFSFTFANNSAPMGGDDIYGASLKSNCQVSKFNNCSELLDLDAINTHFHFDTNDSVSGAPSRVCFCDDDGQPQCSKIFMSYTVYPIASKTIKIPIVIVGGDFGATIGTVYVGQFGSDTESDIRNVTMIGQCTYISVTLDYEVEQDNIVVYLSAFPNYSEEYLNSVYVNEGNISQNLAKFDNLNGRQISFALRTTPVFMNVSFLPCPAGFTLHYIYKNCWCLNGGCSLEINDGTVSLKKSYDCVWISGLINSSDYCTVTNYSPCRICSDLCPFDYCSRLSESENTYIYGFDPNSASLDKQCSSNRAGILCGKCKEGYSLALGSNNCIHCENRYLALLIFFGAAGFLLVFIIIILNLTVSQGMINGLIVYANIVWSYNATVDKDYNYPSILEYYIGGNDFGYSSFHAFLKVFLAWLNLDFGIQTCFIEDLNSFGKTWLQFVFPFYIASLFFIGLRFSSKLSKIVGNRAVPTLATLLFLSYTKLLKTIITILGLAKIEVMESGIAYNSSLHTLYVWSVDGNYLYGKYPHIFLVLVAVACLLLLWLPYTILLLLIQWFRKTSNLTLSRWITKYKPVFDAYHAPLNDKHHYWFGVLLLIKGVLLLIITLTANSFVGEIDYIIVLCIATFALFYMNFMQVYRKPSVLVTESLFFINIIILMAALLLKADIIAAYYSSAFLAFVQFCGIVIWNVCWTLYPKYKEYKRNKLSISKQRKKDNSTGLEKPASISVSYVRFRDSILDESHIELNDT